MKYLVVFLSALGLLLVSSSCYEKEKNVIPVTQDSIFYLALGDSYTIGQSVLEEDSYPVQLANKLESENSADITTEIIAKTGWRTDQLINAIGQATLRSEYDLISLLIGVNNQFQGGSVSSCEAEFTQLLEMAINFAGGEKERVFVLSIPDYAFTPFGQNSGNAGAISQGIDDFNQKNKMISDQYGVSYFDITSISREGLDSPELVASDGLHPSAIMYQRWVDLIWMAIQEKIF